MWVIVASNKNVPIITSDFSTTNLHGTPPNYLSIVQTILVLVTRVRVVVIIPSLISPCCNCITWRPIPPASPKQVLAVVAPRVDQRAVAAPLVGPPSGIIGKPCTPSERRDSKFRSYDVVRIQELVNCGVSTGG